MGQKRREEVAYDRASIISPLLNPDLDRAAVRLERQKISERTSISERTLRRWLKAYQQEGFIGLLPREKAYETARVIPEAIVDEAVLLRREVPERSVQDIIRLLELEGRILPGSIKRSTLQDRLEERGYGARQLKMYHSSGAGANRRFEHKERNALWQADIKYLLVLAEKNAKKGRQLYVSAFLDDATRMVTSCRVYDRQDAPAVLDSFKFAIEHYGVPDRLYTDNGKPYVSKALKQVCHRLGIQQWRAKPYAAQSKGKIEVFNRTLEKFVQEERLEHPQSIEQVQHDLDCWLEHFYYTKPHSALKDKSPRQAYYEQNTPLRYLSVEQLNEAFLYRETRLVDKSGCIAFQGSKWEAGSAYIGLKVEVCYSDLHPEVLTIYHELFEPRAIRPLRMAHYTRKEVSPPSLYVKSKVQFPVHTSGNIVSFEGHLNWITSIKEFLPEVKFISASVMPNDDKIKNADQIWIQANYLSHANFYKVINIARNRKIKTRYFKSTSAKRCAEQLIEDQDK